MEETDLATGLRAQGLVSEAGESTLGPSLTLKYVPDGLKGSVWQMTRRRALKEVWVRTFTRWG